MKKWWKLDNPHVPKDDNGDTIFHIIARKSKTTVIEEVMGENLD